MAVLRLDIVVNDNGAVQQINQVESALRNLEGSAAKSSQGVAESVAASPRAIGKALDELSTSVGAHIASTGRLLSSFGSSMSMTVTAPIVAMGGAALKAAIDFESAFSGVAKTVDGIANKNGTLTAFGEELKNSFRELAKMIPVTVNELSQIGETAGAMGIPRDKLLEFTTVVAKLGATTNLSSQEAATALGHIQNAYGQAGENTDRFAAALVDLGNKGASTEAEIVRFAQRMAATGAQLGVSQAQLLGWANAMASIGINAELGSTAWMRTLNAISVAVAQGTPKLQQFAQVAGMSRDAFASLFRQDASEALMRFIEGLSRIQQSGGNVTGVLEELKLKSVGFNITLKGLANAHDMVRQSLETGTKAWRDNAAMEEEFAKKSATMAAQLKMLYNQAYDLAIELGQELIPHIKNMAPAFEGAMNGLVGLVKWFGDLPSPIQTAVIAGTAFLAALGPMAFAIGHVITAGGQMLELMGKLGMWERLGGIIEGASGSMTRLGQASLVAGTALASWQLGRLIAQIFDLDTKIANLTARILGFGDLSAQTSGAKQDTINLALQRGANPRALGSSPDEQYRNAVTYNQEWNANRLKTPRVDTAAAMGGAVIKLPGFGSGAGTTKPPLASPSLDLGGSSGSSSRRTTATKSFVMPSIGYDLGLPSRIPGQSLDLRSLMGITFEPQTIPYRLGMTGAVPGTRVDTGDMLPALPPAGATSAPVSQLTQGLLAAIMSGGGSSIDGGARILGSRFSSTLKNTIKTSFGSSQQFGTELGNAISGAITSGANIFEASGRFVTTKISSGIKSTLQNVRQTLVSDLVNMAGANIRAAVDQAPKLVQTMASAVFGALQSGQNPFVAVGSKLGTDFGSQIAQSLGKHLSGGLGHALGGALNSLLPGIGSLLGPLLGAIGGKVVGFFKNLFGGNQVKDLINQTFGSYDALREQLNPLGPEGDAMWVRLTQQTGKGDVNSARQQIEAINAALEAHRQHLNESTTAAQQLGASESQAFQQAMNSVGELDTKIKNLQQSIANEAPEEVMGIVEQQARAQIQALQEQQSQALQSMDQIAQDAGMSVQAIIDQLRAQSIHIPVFFDVQNQVPGLQTAGPYEPYEAPEATPMARGGIVRARPGGTIVRVGEAGRDEAIVPLGSGGFGGINLTINGSLIHERDLGEYIADVLTKTARRTRAGA